MKLTIELGQLSVSINVSNDKKVEEILTIYATYHGMVRKGMNRRQVLRAALRQMLNDARQQAMVQFKEERRKAIQSEAETATILKIEDDEIDTESKSK